MRQKLKVLGVAAVSALALAVSWMPDTNAQSGPKTLVIVLGGSPSDTFWTAVARGARDAGKAMAAYGGVVDYLGPKNYDNFGPDMARLNQTALARKPAAVVSANWLPGNQTPGLQAISKSGIPLFEYNTGTATLKTDGALKYVGTDEKLAGETAGKAFIDAGVKNAICVNTVPGAINLETRCNGVKDGMESGGGTAKTLQLPSSTFGNPSAVTQAIKGAMLADATIDGIITVGTSTGDYAAEAIKAANKSGKVKLSTFDIAVPTIQRILDGDMLFAVDQQPYLQGFYAATMAFQYARFGLLPANTSILTGPLLITKDNAAKVLEGAKAGIRGAN
jgi:simple sugar transport system substrate-binding protein